MLKAYAESSGKKTGGTPTVQEIREAGGLEAWRKAQSQSTNSRKKGASTGTSR